MKHLLVFFPSRLSLLFLLVLIPFLSISCRPDSETLGIDGSTDTGLLPPVENLPKVAPNQKPAFPEQTRAPGVETKAAIQVLTVAEGLNRPWGLVFLPDGRMLVSEKSGTIRIVTGNGTLGNPIANVPSVRSQGDGGLMDLQLDPDFRATRLVFWSYVEPKGNTGVNCVARGRLSVDERSFENVTVIYRGTSPYAGFNHNGSRMIFDRNGLLYVTFGERFDNGIRAEAQRLTSSLGKVIRINKDGSPATSNPFVTTGSSLPEILALGYRNPQGLAFHPKTGDLWATDHGPQAGDELNLVKSGFNYGWPIISYGLEYDGTSVGVGTSQNGMEQPVYYWDPTVAPSGMTFYTGDLIPEWRDNLFIATLAGGHVIRLVIENNKVVGEERLLTDKNSRMRHVVQGPDGFLYVVTDEAEGKIFKMGI